MQIEQLLRRYYEAVGTWMLYFNILVPLLAECSESVPSCHCIICICTYKNLSVSQLPIFLLTKSHRYYIIIMILHYKVQITIYRIYSIWSVAVATLRPELSGLFIFYNAGNINFLHLFYVSDYFTCFFSSEFIQMSLLHHSQTSTFYFIKHNITRVEDPLRGFLFLSS